jgi:hypothetical protein
MFLNFDFALLLTQLGLALAVAAQAIEHRRASRGEWRLMAWRGGAAVLLLVGVMWSLWASQTPGATIQAASIGQALRAAASWVIFGLGVLSLKRFGGPYCGGSDLMTLQVSLCMALAESSTSPAWRLGAAGYLSIQVCLSYWQSGWVKLVNPEWRNGRALREVFAYTHYPVSEATRHWARTPRLLWVMGWLIMLMEFFFPLSLYYRTSLCASLVFMGLFHLANAWFFGLNRFFWIWITTYPTLLAWQPFMAEFMRR